VHGGVDQSLLELGMLTDQGLDRFEHVTSLARQDNGADT
jgi:hypothetical protein